MKKHYRTIQAAAVPPRAQEWPRAFALLTESRALMSKTCTGMAIGGLMTVLLPPVCLCVFGACAAATAVLTMLRIFLIATYFTRYSLAQLTGVYMAVSLCVSLMMVFPGEYKILPGAALACVILCVAGYIRAQDPQGDNFLPPFVREKMIERRRLLREKAKGQGSGGQGSGVRGSGELR